MRIVDDTPPPGREPIPYPRRSPQQTAVSDIRAKWIAFEGVDGAGKSTLIRNLKRRFESQARRVRVVSLTGSELTVHALERARWANANPISMSLIYWVGLYDQVSGISADPLSDIVLFDRYVYSLLARANLEGVDPALTSFLAAGLPKPSSVFVLDIDPLVAYERILQSRSPSYWEAGREVEVPDAGRAENFLAYQAKFRQQLTRLAEADTRACLIDARSPAKAITDQVAARLQSVTASR